MKKIILSLAVGLLSLTTFEGMSQNKNKVIAHSGAWKNTGATENSIGALEHAIKLGCYGSEFDVHMSADSVLFVLHDHSIKGTHIEKSTAQELSQIKLENGEALPTLEAYLKAGSKQKKTRLILEIKIFCQQRKITGAGYQMRGTGQKTESGKDHRLHCF
jgi:glycerophosphoryl diester phosphodiesterase